ncbi:MAG TPA: hypothetical protein VJ813_03315 [Vicinamibacterales bacterium]|nr:hypothetical protein [Vicinamibacterales bacterium]
MNLFGWLKGKNKRDDARDQWRAAWAAAIDDGDTADAELRLRIEELAKHEADVEVELEMLDALEQLRTVQRTAANGNLPAVETHHRVIGREPCHFTAPASLPSDQAQASGRVLLTGARSVFVGGGRTSATAWHAVHEVARIERDVLLVRADRSPAAHFRFNTYADAAVCAFLARRLKGSRRASL